MSVHVQSGPPDAKTRKYDRQLRLWAATGQAALEGARLLVIGGTATSTQILKNLVLPGIGHFTVLDPNEVKPEDVGNNFFLEVESIGKAKAVETTRLLSELNDSVDSAAETHDIAEIIENNLDFLSNYTLVITHNLPRPVVDKIATYLWAEKTRPSLIVVKTAGFLAEFYIQCHEHTVVDSHSEEKVSLRIDKPFPSLLEKSLSIDLKALDQTDHGHVPFVYILIQAVEQWKQTHDGKPPSTFAERKELQKHILSLKVKGDEENFDEAVQQAYKIAPGTSNVPSAIKELFEDPKLKEPLTKDTPPFFHLLAALKDYVAQEPHTLPVSSTLPDMKADTKSYVALQQVYKDQARRERDEFAKVLEKRGRPDTIDETMIDDFVKNAHGLKVLRSSVYGALDGDSGKLNKNLTSKTRETATHLAFAALDTLGSGVPPTVDNLRASVDRLLGQPSDELPEEVDHAIGELARAPTADLPTTAGFVGGLVAQEAIKLITKQYIPQIGGYIVIDLIGSWTGVVQ